MKTQTKAVENLFNKVKDSLGKFTDEQLAILNYEVWNEAYKRSTERVKSEK